MGNKHVFLDRDGTMAPDVHYCSRPEDADATTSDLLEAAHKYLHGKERHYD